MIHPRQTKPQTTAAYRLQFRLDMGIPDLDDVEKDHLRHLLFSISQALFVEVFNYVITSRGLEIILKVPPRATADQLSSHQTPSLSGPRPADDATREKQIPFRLREARATRREVEVSAFPHQGCLEAGPAAFYDYYIEEPGLRGSQVNTPFPVSPAKAVEESGPAGLTTAAIVIPAQSVWSGRSRCKGERPRTVEAYRMMLPPPEAGPEGEPRTLTSCAFFNNRWHRGFA